MSASINISELAAELLAAPTNPRLRRKFAERQLGQMTDALVAAGHELANHLGEDRQGHYPRLPEAAFEAELGGAELDRVPALLRARVAGAARRAPERALASCGLSGGEGARG